MTGREVLDAAALCAKCGEFGSRKCKGQWITDPVTNRAHYEKGESKNCPFDGKPNCYKVLFRSLLTLTNRIIAGKETEK